MEKNEYNIEWVHELFDKLINMERVGIRRKWVYARRLEKAMNDLIVKKKDYIIKKYCK